MDLLPASAPVYGGGIIEIGLFGDLEIPELSRLFLVFDGSKQRQVTEAKKVNGRRLQAVIPDHEPPEIVALSLIVKNPSTEPVSCRTIAQDTFTYFLDQTCYLARYLADSVHDLEGLEDWDFIRGPQFCLANEDFPTLDERLTSAFQHLILPSTWNLLGDPTSAHISRETLFHFATRLGLSSFVTLLLEKNGANECLEIRNEHNELAQDIARSKSYDGLADLITDPHAHGVIRWESTRHISPTTTIKRHSFGTVTMSSEMHQGDFPPIEKEIDIICDNHPAPTPDEVILDEDRMHNGINQDQFAASDDLEITNNTSNEIWDSDDLPPPPPLRAPMIVFAKDGPPPVPPKPADLYVDYEDDAYNPETGAVTSSSSQNESGDYLSAGDQTYFHASNESNSLPATGDPLEESYSPGILDENLLHLQKINSDIHYIRQKDIARITQSTPSEAVRLSNSCPNLGQEGSFVSTDTECLDSYESPTSARSRKGFAIPAYDSEFQSQLETYSNEDDLSSQSFLKSLTTESIEDDSHADYAKNLELEIEDSDNDDIDDGDDSPSRRPHSWHSVEKLNEMRANVIPNAAVVSHKRSKSYQGDELARIVLEQQSELTPEEKAEQADTITSPAVRRVRRHNNNTFAIVGQDNRAIKTRSLGPINASMNNNNNTLDQDRRFTFSEGTLSNQLIRKLDENEEIGEFDNRSRQMSVSEFLSDPTNFEAESHSPIKPKTSAPAVPPKPTVVPRPDGQSSKSTVSRTLSFLTKMRGSQRTKTTGSKERVKKPVDTKSGSSTTKHMTTGDNLTETKEKDTTRDFSWHAVKAKPKKGPSTGSANKANNMMINKMPTYGPALQTPVPYFTQDGRVHGLPVRPSIQKPAQSYDSGKFPDSTDGKYSKLSYKNDGDSASLHSGSRTPPQLSHYSTVSGSVESIDEAVDMSELENDPDLMLKHDEPEAWSVTVEKKFLDKMHKKNIKRQDNIFEFLQKERNFLTTLKIMQKIFGYGMLRELQYEQETVDKMFPQIDEFVEFTSNFVEQLDERQRVYTHKDKVIAKIGDIMVEQWSGENGRQMLWLFGEFCSKQKEIVSLYKDLIKNDKKFQDFITRCGKNPLTRRRDIPGCILLVTQRITKYPVILKTLIDNSARKEHKSDTANLNHALDLITDIIKKVDNQVLEYEKKMRVTEIYQKMESKSYATYKDGRKFTRDDFYPSISKLLQVDTLQWRPNTVRRTIDVIVVLFKDVLVFLQENNQRYSFASVNQPAAVPLHKLIVREKAGEDSVLFLLSASSDKPEMYELVFQTASHSKNWMQWIRAAVEACPEEDEGVSYQDVEEQRLMEQKWVQADQIISDLETKDKELNHLLQEKMKKFKMLAKVLERPEVTVNMKYSYPTYLLDVNDPKSKKLPEGKVTLQKAVEEVHKLSQAICGPGGLNRNPSSVGEHDSGTHHVTSLPKRSETFGGFDNGKEPPSPRTRFATIGSKYSHKHDSEEDVRKHGKQKKSGTHSEGDITSAVGSPPSGGESPSSSHGQHGIVLPPTPDQISALAQLTHLLNEYMSIATQQDTQVQKMSLNLMRRTQSRRRGGDKFLEDEARRNQAKHTELEQDLTKREENLKSQKDQWIKEHKKKQMILEAEKSEFEEKLEELRRQKFELDRDHEELKRNKEEYQKQLARLREQQRKLPQEHGMTHSASHPVPLNANKNNSNSAPTALYEQEGVDEYQNAHHANYGVLTHGLGSMQPNMSKSQSSLEGELGDNPASKESHSPTYSAGDYPRTFPGPGKRDPAQQQSIQAPAIPAGQAGTAKPIHLQYSATNQIVDHKATPHSVIPGNLSSAKSKHGSQQLFPSKLKGLAGSQPSQSSSKPASKSKQKFSHKKSSKSGHGSSDLPEIKPRSSTLTIPNSMKHSKSDANLDAARNRSTSSPSPAMSLLPPESESGLERSNSASSNSSKEGHDKKKGKKRRSWGTSDKPGEKHIYQV